MTSKSDRSLRKLQRERREVQREMQRKRDEIRANLRQLRAEPDEQLAGDTTIDSFQNDPKSPARSEQQTPGSVPATVADASTMAQQPATSTVSLATTADARDRIDPSVDLVFDASSLRAQLATIPKHLASEATHTGAGINPVVSQDAGTYVPIGAGLDPGHMPLVGTSTPKESGMPLMSGNLNASKHTSPSKDGQTMDYRPGGLREDHRPFEPGAHTGTQSAAGLDGSVQDDDFTDSGGDSGEEEKLSFAGHIPVKSSGEKDVREQELKTMQMLNDLLIQSREISRKESESREKVPETVYKPVDIELEEKATMERIRSMIHEEKLLTERKLRKEKEMREAEDRLRILKEKGSRFEEALIEREKHQREEQKKLQRLQFIKNEERKLAEALRLQEEKERYYDTRIETLKQEEQSVLSYIVNKQREYDERMSTVMRKREEAQDIKPQTRTIRKEKSQHNTHVKQERNDTRNPVHDIGNETYRNRESRDIESDRNTYENSDLSGIETDGQSSRKEELDRKEAYLKQLEAELLKKENEIRAKIGQTPVTNSTSGAAVEQTVKAESATGSVKPEPSVFEMPGQQQFGFVKPNVSLFSGLEPVPKNESTFEAWRLEIESLRNRLPEYLVNQLIRNSLKVPARNTLLTLGPLASSQEILKKLESVFGNVASGQSILQEFYTAFQQPDESVTMWSLRLEEIAQRIESKTKLSKEQKNDMLKERFWRSLYSTELQNATQVFFHQTTDFEELRGQVRTEELARFTHKKAVQEVSTVQPKAPEKPNVQHQPLTFSSDKQKKVQDLENKLDRVDKQLRANRNWWNRQQRLRKKQNKEQNQTPQDNQQQQINQQERQAQINERLGQTENNRQYAGDKTGQNTNGQRQEQNRKNQNKQNQSQNLN